MEFGAETSTTVTLRSTGFGDLSTSLSEAECDPYMVANGHTFLETINNDFEPTGCSFFTSLGAGYGRYNQKPDSTMACSASVQCVDAVTETVNTRLIMTSSTDAIEVSSLGFEADVSPTAMNKMIGVTATTEELNYAGNVLTADGSGNVAITGDASSLVQLKLELVVWTYWSRWYRHCY